MELIIAETTDTLVSLDLTVDRGGVGGITGLSPTVSLRDAATLDSFLDFSDNTFKTVGWTTKNAPMSSAGRGHYRRTLDVTAFSPSAGDIFVVEYHVDDGGDVVGDAHDKLITINSFYDVPADVWDSATAAHTTAGTFGAALQSSLSIAQAAQLLDIYRVLGLDPTAPLIVSKTARAAGPMVQTIEEDVPVSGSVKVTRT